MTIQSDMESGEKLLPLGEEETQVPPPSHFHLENKLAPARPAQAPTSALPRFSVEPHSPSGVLMQEPQKESVIPKPVLPPLPKPVVPPSDTLPGVPSPQAQSWGAVISIIIIVLMIIIGAFYAWGKRIAQENALIAPESAQ